MGSKKSEKLSFYTQPWFVVGVVLSCFAVLTPKIFVPLFRQLVGIKSTEPNLNSHDRLPPPNLRSRYSSNQNPNEAQAQFGRPNPLYNPQAQGSSSSGKSILTFFLPVYAIGIGLYMLYILYKVFNKKDKKENENGHEDSDFDSYKRKIYDFTERSYGPNLDWISDSNESKAKKSKQFCLSEETEDELNNYEKYKNLEPEYVNHLKDLRRKKRKEARKSALHSTRAANIAEQKQIPLTKNIGLSSVTNTNVLLNETLERMKYSLNKINKQISETEKKGESLEDPDLDDLRLQLAQTEQQMAKIVKIISAVSVDLDDKKIVLDENFDSDEEFEKTKEESKSTILNNRKPKTRDSLDESLGEESSVCSSIYSSKESCVQKLRKKKKNSKNCSVNELKNEQNGKMGEKKVTFNEFNIKKSKKRKQKKK
ncbi:Resistance to inhibitors of cholinesterase 3 [Brachionus plicatilis]|uniref:Resistance to inhibitors of cholinesterase 3 n=1 Tax=Brachionus plicatilis TaxID=10195 RepID=A0A3M7QLS9_BRAPC|nr:Resistance to inhibitors of cholinesterase 3 [Brachionus plicatilis]